jgi:hypothetical protein
MINTHPMLSKDGHQWHWMALDENFQILLGV